MKVKILSFVLSAFCLLFITQAKAAGNCHDCHYQAVTQVFQIQPAMVTPGVGSLVSFGSFSNYQKVTGQSLEQEYPGSLLKEVSADPSTNTWPARAVIFHIVSIKSGYPLGIATKGFYASLILRC